MIRAAVFCLLAIPAPADLTRLDLIGPGGVSVYHDGHWDHNGIHIEQPSAAPEACPLLAVAAAGAALMLRRERRAA